MVKFSRKYFMKRGMSCMKQISVIVIGAGVRGITYSNVMKKHPDKFKIVGVAEPHEARRKAFQKEHGISDEAAFATWESILGMPKMADLAVIATQDKMHYSSAMKAIELGYDILLEKPVAPTERECADIANAAKAKGVKVLVCHVLRYTAFFKTIKKMILEGRVGKIMSIVHVEAVGDVHQTHSFIRGAWHDSKESAPMLLAKSCHDIDILQWLIDKPCKKVTSFGDLTYFTEKNAPDGAPVRCADGGCPIEDTCPYNVFNRYYKNENNLWFRTACTAGIAEHNPPTNEDVMKALKTTDYGLCVFHANNNVVDHQVVNMQFEGGVTVSFSMNCFNKGGRYIRIFGTKGELYANMSDEKITLFNMTSRKTEEIPVPKVDETILGGHGGGDIGIVLDLYDYLNGIYTGFSVAEIGASVANHMIVFAAEEARHTGTVVDVDEYFKKYNYENKYQ